MNVTTKLSATLVATLLFAPAFIPAAFADEKDFLDCTPDQNKTENHIKLERIAPDMVHAAGTVMGPTPAHQAAIFNTSGQLTLKIMPPKAGTQAAQMISALKIDQTLTVPPLAPPVSLKIDKNFNWGPTVFVCDVRTDLKY